VTNDVIGTLLKTHGYDNENTTLPPMCNAIGFLVNLISVTRYDSVDDRQDRQTPGGRTLFAIAIAIQRKVSNRIVYGVDMYLCRASYQFRVECHWF